MKQTIEVEIPDGYEFVGIHLQQKDTPDPYLYGELRKKEVKDFRWYVSHYEQTSKNEYKLLYCSFETNIGLLKFICDDMSIDFWKFCYSLSSLAEKYLSPEDRKVYNLCPIEFLQSIFKTK
jgi:hypothetical protein